MRNKSKSPYQRHAKAPFQYSQHYKSWRDALLGGNHDEAERCSQLHYERVVRPAQHLADAARQSAHAEREADREAQAVLRAFKRVPSSSLKPVELASFRAKETELRAVRSGRRRAA